MFDSQTNFVQNRYIWCLILFFMSLSPVVNAADTSSSSLRFSGFGTIGITNTIANEGLGFRRNTAQPNNDGGLRADIDSLLGIQVNYSPSTQFEFVGQLIAKRRSSVAPTSDSIQWAFAAYRFTPSLAFRAGRLDTAPFLLVNYRNVGFAYRYARPPVELYSVLPSALDGVDITKDFMFDDINWRFIAFAGKSVGGDLSVNSRVSFDPVYGIKVSREYNGLSLHLGFADFSFTNNPAALLPLLESLKQVETLPFQDIVAQAAQYRSDLDNTDANALYKSFAVNYEGIDWLFTMEATQVTGHPSVNLTAGYMNIGRRIGLFTVFGGYSRLSTPTELLDAPDWATQIAPILGPEDAQELQQLANYSTYALNSLRGKQSSLSIGARWDFRSNVALKVQFDHIKIDANGGRLWPGGGTESSTANVATLMLDFVY